VICLSPAGGSIRPAHHVVSKRLAYGYFGRMGVVFAIGSRPTLSDTDAQALVGLIAADPTPFTTKLAAKINRGLLDGDSAQEIELKRDELVEIADALSVEPKLLLDVPTLRPLHDEVIATLA
jgi:hypothetical protein